MTARGDIARKLRTPHHGNFIDAAGFSFGESGGLILSTHYKSCDIFLLTPSRRFYSICELT
jgi:hypothetical protein